MSGPEATPGLGNAFQAGYCRCRAASVSRPFMTIPNLIWTGLGNHKSQIGLAGLITEPTDKPFALMAGAARELVGGTAEICCRMRSRLNFPPDMLSSLDLVPGGAGQKALARPRPGDVETVIPEALD